MLSCAPGTEKIERLDEKTYDCVVKQKVGSISVKFKFKSVLTKVGASIVGKLAMFGDRIMRARAKKLQAELTSVLDGKFISLV